VDSTAPLGKPFVDVGTACENDLHCIGNQKRYRALLVIENPPAISAWRDGLDEAQVRRLDHPNAVWFARRRDSEKIRLALGLKGLSWRSVEIPVWTPRPKLTPMTGGYSRTPILQVGAEFYCDTPHLKELVPKLDSVLAKPFTQLFLSALTGT
jgi:hypothetical protein